MANNNYNQSWLHLASIQVGGCICLPVIMIGHVLCEHYGFYAALTAIVAGNLILLALGFAATSMGATGRRSTVENASLYFGEQGSALFAFLMVGCMLGWFAIQLNMINMSAMEILRYLEFDNVHSLIVSLIIGGAITLLVMKGLNGMGWMANLCTPLLIVTLVLALLAAPMPSEMKSSTTFEWEGISLVMAASIATVIDLPNFFRYARTQRDSTWAIIILFGIATPLIEGIGVYLASSLPGLPLLDALKISQNGAWGLWSPVFLLVGGWITNNANLFSATVSAEMLLPKLSNKRRTFILGCIGILIACANPAEHLEFAINAMGIAIGSMGGVIITGHLLGPSSGVSLISYPMCWVFGAATGYCALFLGPSLTGIALLDAFLVSGVLMGIKNYLEKRTVYETN